LDKNIFFDLDGTLIDSRQRLFQLFTSLTSQNIISFDEYWTYKGSKESNADILKKRLNFSSDQVNTFILAWFKMIEDEQYLKKDSLFNDTIPSLEQLKSDATLYIITARQFPDRVYKQMSWLGIDKYFKKILVTEQKKTKAELIKPFFTKGCSIIIGDTGEDIIAGKNLGMITINVLTGFRNEEVLKTYSPDYIFSDLNAFCKAINGIL
jgi:phosphoglycolate phosphatase